MGIKYSMEGFIKYLKINTAGNSKRGFTVGLPLTTIFISINLSTNLSINLND